MAFGFRSFAAFAICAVFSSVVDGLPHPYYHGPPNWKDWGSLNGYPLPTTLPTQNSQSTSSSAESYVSSTAASYISSTTASYVSSTTASYISTVSSTAASNGSSTTGSYVSSSTASYVSSTAASNNSSTTAAYVSSTAASNDSSTTAAYVSSTAASYVSGNSSRVSTPTTYASSSTSAHLASSTTAYPLNTSTPVNVTSENTTIPNIIRGVNIGGWLLLEKWMNEDLFDGTVVTDQWHFDSLPDAQSKLESHWETYFTEADVQKIASWGINALRIPIGYWAYNNAGTPYITGADKYLERAIGWARNAGLKVLVDCHGSPGSQNGFDNSGQAGNVAWQSTDNLVTSISVLETIAEKYGSSEYADVVFGIELANEPISWGANSFEKTQEWSKKAYAAVKAKATNENLQIIMHDGFMGPSNWQTVGEALNGNAAKSDAKFAVDVHLYQNMEAPDSTLTQDQHIAKACGWTDTELLPGSSALPVYVGEFSAQTNICANPDGSTVAGTTCFEDGCQCDVNVPLEYWNPPLVEATRRYVEAQLDAFEHSAAGWFMWSYKGPGAWGLANAIEYGLIGSKVTDRLYPGQCNFATSS